MAQNFIASIQLRRDTKANWEKINPVLKDGEFVIITDTSEYKVGDGVTKFNALPVKGYPAVQDKGTSTSNVMSQKAVTDELNRLDINKFEKSNVSSQYPSVEPSDDTSVISAKQQFKKDKEQADKMAQLEQEVNLFNRKPQGLRFKAGDNTVFAKTMKSLALGTDDFTVCVVARSNGSTTYLNPLLGYSKPNYSNSSLKVFGDGTNDLSWLLIGSKIDAPGTSTNSIAINKTDNTTNLHHIVISRSGTLVTCTINGRLVKSVTQDRVLDFSNFIYDIANTSYFWGGAVFNYAMTQSESNKLLWNGGRYDEVRLPVDLFNVYNKLCVFPNMLVPAGGESIEYSSVGNSFDLKVLSAGTLGNSPRFQFQTSIADSSVYILEFDYVVKSGTCAITSLGATNLNTTLTASGHFKSEFNNDKQPSLNMRFDGRNIFNISVTNAKVYKKNCLLEYRPENIRSDHYLNSGTAGSDYDLVYSQTPPEIIYVKPYADKIVFEDKAAPADFPIAVGQRCYTNTGSIYEANLPAMGSEWAVSNWKQVNNG